MITILLDSSNTSLSVGIAKDGKLLDYISYEAWQRQSEYMLPELEKILVRNNVNKTDISDVVVAIGPGSYISQNCNYNRKSDGDCIKHSDLWR